MIFRFLYYDTFCYIVCAVAFKELNFFEWPWRAGIIVMVFFNNMGRGRNRITAQITKIKITHNG